MVVKSLFNSMTMMVMLQACYVSKSLIHGSQLHGYAIKRGLVTDGLVQNSSLKMYTRTGRWNYSVLSMKGVKFIVS